MEKQGFLSKLKKAAPGCSIDPGPFGRRKLDCAWTLEKDLVTLAMAAKSNPELDLDWLENMSVAEIEGDLVFTYFLRSSTNQGTLILRALASKPKKHNQKLAWPSVSAIWGTAEIWEQEIAELFGVDFSINKEPRFGLLPGFFPLRKAEAKKL